MEGRMDEQTDGRTHTRTDECYFYIPPPPTSGDNNLGNTCVHNATYQVPRSSDYRFWRRFFKFFLSYMGMAAILVM